MDVEIAIMLEGKAETQSTEVHKFMRKKDWKAEGRRQNAR
jgi:hypothetical protein